MSEAADDDATFGLDRVLGALSRDLRAAELAAKEEGVGLFLQEAEVELSFTVEGGGEGEFDLNLRVFGVGLGGKRSKRSSEESVHRITLKLGPSDPRQSEGRNDGDPSYQQQFWTYGTFKGQGLDKIAGPDRPQKFFEPGPQL